MQLKVSDQFYNDLILYTPLPKGGRIKNLNSNLIQNFCFKYLGKVKKLWFNIYMCLKAINKTLRGGALRASPGLIGLRTLWGTKVDIFNWFIQWSERGERMFDLPIELSIVVNVLVWISLITLLSSPSNEFNKTEIIELHEQ